MTVKKLISVACTAALATLSAGAQAQISGGVVKIGVLTDLSGTYSDLAGSGAVLATKMAVEDFIAKEKPNFKIEVVSADHQNKADIASNKAREWFEREGVDTATELVTTSVALAVMKVAKEKERIALMSGPASTPITNEQCNDVTVHYTYDTYALANGTAKAVLEGGGKSWYMLTADYAFGHALEADITKVVQGGGGSVVGTVRHPFPSQDFSSYILQAQGSGAEVVALANAGADTVNALKTASQFGVTQSGQKLAGMLVFLNDVHAMGLDVTQGLMLTTGWYWDMNEETRAWAKRYHERVGSMPTMSQAGVYSATMHYLNAVKATGSDDTTTVRAKMAATPVNDMFAKGGKIREDGRMVHDMYLAQVKTPAESKGEWDLYKILSTIPGEQAFRPLAESQCRLVTGKVAQN